MEDPLSDCSPLIRAASAGRLRLVRLLVEGGAQVNGCNPRGETALLAACKALRGEPAGPETLRLLTYLLRNKAEPNAQDGSGRTALMYACMERAGAQVASTLLQAGADPSMEDHSGASALVYAINAQHQPTLKVLMDACRAKGRDIIIIATETDVNGGPVTRRYLNVPPSPDTSPVSCMSPSDIVLRTGPANSSQGENIFNFRGTNKPGSGTAGPPCEPSPPSSCGTAPARRMMPSQPGLAVRSLACPNKARKEGEDMGKEDEEGEDEEDEQPQSHTVKRPARGERNGGRRSNSSGEDSSQLAVSLAEIDSSHAESSGRTPGGSDLKQAAHSQLRRNTLPSVTVLPPLRHLPPLVSLSHSLLQVPSKVSSLVFLPHPPDSPPPPPACTWKASARPGPLPQIPHASSVTSLVTLPGSCDPESCRRRSRRRSLQLQ